MAVAKKREVDFSLEDMLELTGLQRKQFYDALLRFCEMYEFNIVDFKVDETKEKSGYFFPPEIATPLALMLKHLGNHPLYRKNTDPSTVTASALAKYNKEIIKSIDEELPAYFNHAVHSLNGTLVAQEISDWTEAFVRELTHFMYNLSTMEMQDVGATLKNFTRRLTDMNYNLYRSNYNVVQTIQMNRQYDMEYYGLPDDSEIDKRLQKFNISIDKLLAELIRWEMEGAHKMRELGFPELKEILDHENVRLKFIGEKYSICDRDGNKLFTDIPNPTTEQQREAYYSFVLGQTINEAAYQNNKYIACAMKEYRDSWQPIDEKIKLGSFEGNTVREEYKRALREEMDTLQKRMDCLQKELDVIDGRESVPFSIETDEELLQRQNDYVKYCKEIDKKQKRLHDIVDHFVGQALNEFLK